MLGKTLKTLIVFCLPVLLIKSTLLGSQIVSVVLDDFRKRVEISIDGKQFTNYKYASLQKYPYFWPVNGPLTNKSVTTQTSWPYPHHHSLFFGCDEVNGGNYWQESNEHGQIISEGPVIINSEGDRVIFNDVCLWRKPGEDPVIRDNRRIIISAPNKELRIIDFEITLDPLTDIRIKKTNHSLFSARVVPEISVRAGGTMINAEGDTGEDTTWGVESPWMDYYGTHDGFTEGIAILQNPNNRWFPSKWFTRDYGFFSPTPMYWPPNDEYIDLKEDENLTLRYRVIVHAGDVNSARIHQLYEEYERQSK